MILEAVNRIREAKGTVTRDDRKRIAEDIGVSVFLIQRAVRAEQDRIRRPPNKRKGR